MESYKNKGGRTKKEKSSLKEDSQNKHVLGAISSDNEMVISGTLCSLGNTDVKPLTKSKLAVNIQQDLYHSPKVSLKDKKLLLTLHFCWFGLECGLSK